MTKLVTNNSVYILTDAPPIADEGPHEGRADVVRRALHSVLQESTDVGFRSSVQKTVADARALGSYGIDRPVAPRDAQFPSHLW